MSLSCQVIINYKSSTLRVHSHTYVYDMSLSYGDLQENVL